MKRVSSILIFCLFLSILLAGCIPMRRPPSSSREDRMKQMIASLSLTREQILELRDRLRIINIKFDTTTQIQHNFFVALSNFRGEFDRINKEEFREDPCPPNCQRLADVYRIHTVEIQNAYQRLEEAVISFLEWLNRNMSQDQLRLIYRFIDDELRNVSLRGEGIVLRHIPPQEDRVNPPYPRARLSQPGPETTVRDSIPKPRLREPEIGIPLSKRVVEKMSVRAPSREMPSGPVNLETVLTPFRGVPMHTTVVFLKELFLLTDNVLTQLLGQ